MHACDCTEANEASRFPKWVKTSEELVPIKDKVTPLIDQAAQDYVKANAGWPKRSEACDKVVSK